MKSVLMLAYSFPPEGNAGAYRPLRFVRHLPRLGWRCVVLSSDGARFERYDPGLLECVPDGTEIHRVEQRDLWQSIQGTRSARQARRNAPATADPLAEAFDRNHRLRSHAREFIRNAESWWYHPDLQMSWIKPAAEAGVRVCTGNRPNVLWATGPPWSSFLAAERVHEITGVPYVLDFRTSWTIVPNSFEARRPMWARRRDRNTLRRLLSKARAVTFFYEAEAECFWRMYRGALDSSRIHIIPNGFDGDVEDFILRPGEKFNLLYTGTLADYRYDTFLRALRLLKQQTPGLARQLTVDFVGEGFDDLIRQASELGVDDMTSTSPPVPYADVNIRQQRAHALLMLERRPMKGYELLAGAKLFNYLRAGRPILGVVPSGEAERILRGVGVSTIADPESPDEICAVLKKLLDRWSAGHLGTIVPHRPACERYSADEQTRALVRALEGIPAFKPFVPGSVDIVPSLRADISAVGVWA